MEQDCTRDTRSPVADFITRLDADASKHNAMARTANDQISPSQLKTCLKQAVHSIRSLQEIEDGEDQDILAGRPEWGCKFHCDVLNKAAE